MLRIFLRNVHMELLLNLHCFNCSKMYCVYFAFRYLTGRNVVATVKSWEGHDGQ